ncbi:MAG: HupE/UreJ family protein [Verrucomicrobiaceae bacterium]
MRAFIFVGFFFWLLGAAGVSAHQLSKIQGEFTVSEDRWVIDVLVEAWAIYPEDGPRAVLPADGIIGLSWMETLDDEDWRRMKAINNAVFEDYFLPALDGEALGFEISYPDLAKTPPSFETDEEGVALIHTRLEGELPEGKEGVFTITWEDPDEALLLLSLKGAEALQEPFEEGALLFETGEGAMPVFRVSSDGKVTTEAGALSLWKWIHLGFVHILPMGLDHILFIVGLFLLQPKWKPLLYQTSAFTVAHSITLALVILGVFSVPAQIVESMIALSIAYVGIENLWVKELKPWRVILVFGLGLLHGMGFASVMGELDLPAGSLLKPLIGFNVGVELGQITVLVMAFVLTFWGFKKGWFPCFRKVVSGMIAVVGLYWTFERMMG